MSFRDGDTRLQKMTGWLLRPTPRAWSVTVYSIVVALCVTLAIQFSETQSLTRRVRNDETQQAANRAQNVIVWCGAISRLDHALTTYIARFPGVPPLNLKQLHCKHLAHATLASGSEP